MKRIFGILAVILLLLTGCSTSAEILEVSIPDVTEVAMDTTETEAPREEVDQADTASYFSAGKETERIEPEKVSETKPPVMPDPPVETEPKEKVSTTESQVTKPRETDPTVNTEESVVVPEVKRPTASDIEAKTAEYINQYRLAQGDTQAIILPGLTAVAEYRAKQLITNFSHTDSADACTTLQYGEFVDMTLYGCDASANYYQGYNREAIAKGNWVGTADEIGQRIATGFKNSSKHWNYVGSSEYGYMAVGAVYDSATSSWYVCICMSSKNYGG